MKKLSLKILLTSAATLLIAASCHNIPSDERLLPVEKTNVAGKRTVLLEDFTGVHCVNCPKAAQAIHEIKTLYGEKVVAVGLHGAVAFTSKESPLFSTDAEAYYTRFAPGVALPAGMINRKKFPGKSGIAINEYGTWSNFVNQELELPQLLSIKHSAASKGEKQLTASVEIEKVEGATLPAKMMLQVWVIEDGIKHEQLGVDDKYNYIHNHVLRGAVNGTWGEALTLGKKYSYDYTLPRVGDIENCSLVTFVYDGDTMEVLEAGLTHLKK